MACHGMHLISPQSACHVGLCMQAFTESQACVQGAPRRVYVQPVPALQPAVFVPPEQAMYVMPVPGPGGPMLQGLPGIGRGRGGPFLGGRCALCQCDREFKTIWQAASLHVYYASSVQACGTRILQLLASHEACHTVGPLCSPSQPTCVQTARAELSRPCPVRGDECYAVQGQRQVAAWCRAKAAAWHPWRQQRSAGKPLPCP